jgi:hypothetical protein
LAANPHLLTAANMGHPAEKKGNGKDSNGKDKSLQE